MVGLVGQAGQQQFATASKTDIAQAGFGQAVQNQPVLVAGKATKAKVAEYQFPYKVGEKIGDFNDKNGVAARYGIFFNEVNPYLDEIQQNRQQLNLKDAKQLSIGIAIIVNGYPTRIRCEANPNKQKINDAINNAIKNDYFKGHDGQSFALPYGYRSDGKGRHIEQNVLEMNIGDFSTPSWWRRPVSPLIKKGSYDIGKIYPEHDVYNKLRTEVAARGGEAFQKINIKDLKYLNIEGNVNPSFAVNHLCNVIIHGKIIKHGGVINISVSKLEKDKLLIDYDFRSIAKTARKSEITININEGDRKYSFKPDGSAWLNGKEIAINTL
jgi:hypothetical protein